MIEGPPHWSDWAIETLEQNNGTAYAFNAHMLERYDNVAVLEAGDVPEWVYDQASDGGDEDHYVISRSENDASQLSASIAVCGTRQFNHPSVHIGIATHA